jgi:vacuolar-type H+-ATPase subunit I/STV1
MAALYVLEMVLAVLAPVLALVCFVLALAGNWKSLSRRLLRVGVAGGCLTGAGWLVTEMALAQHADIIWAFGIAIFATGFSGAIVIALAWHAVRKMRFNPKR